MAKIPMAQTLPPAPLTGELRKMSVQLKPGSTKPSHTLYQLQLGEHTIDLNAYLGREFTLHFNSAIYCVHCGRKTKKSFHQGHCYPCFKALAACDICMVSPEKCHYQQGTCREPEWAQEFCMKDHIVYLANSSGAKVGITRASQIPTRWIDQGAVQGLPIYRVQTRHQAGLVEQIYKRHISDKTRWQAMLKGDPAPVNLAALASELARDSADDISALQERYGIQAITALNAPSTDIRYPVLQHPEKIHSLNLDKQPIFSGTLTGIKGQYLLFANSVFNVRKFTGYHISLTIA